MKGEGGRLRLETRSLTMASTNQGRGSQSHSLDYWGRCTSKFGEPLSVFAADRL